MSQSDIHSYDPNTFIEVLQDFNSCKMPFEYLLLLIPKLQPRKFSLSLCMEYYYDNQNCIILKVMRINIFLRIMDVEI